MNPNMMKSNLSRTVQWTPTIFQLLFWLALISLPFWLFSGNFYLGIAIRVFTFASLAYAWNIISGLGGQLSLGNAAFFGIGAYTTALLSINFGVNPWVGMIIGAVLAAIVSVMLGLPCFRLTGIYFALATFAFSLILETVFRHFINITGGDVGLSIPLKGNEPSLFQFSSSLPYYFIGLALLFVFYLINVLVLRSKLGFYLSAIKSDQIAAETLGIDSVKVKLYAFIINAFLTAIIGTFYLQYTLFIDPNSAFGMLLSVQIILVTICGGIGTLWGPILGAAFLIPLGEITNESLTHFGSGFDKIIYSVVLIIFIMLLPKGLVSIPDKIRIRFGNGS